MRTSLMPRVGLHRVHLLAVRTHTLVAQTATNRWILFHARHAELLMTQRLAVVLATHTLITHLAVDHLVHTTLLAQTQCLIRILFVERRQRRLAHTTMAVHAITHLARLLQRTRHRSVIVTAAAVKKHLQRGRTAAHAHVQPAVLPPLGSLCKSHRTLCTETRQKIQHAHRLVAATTLARANLQRKGALDAHRAWNHVKGARLETARAHTAHASTTSRDNPSCSTSQSTLAGSST